MLQLRPARLDDPDALLLIAEVQRYYVEVYGGEDDDPLTPAELAAPRGGFLIADDDGVPVGMGGWTHRSSPSRDAKVRRMFVRPEARRLGVAAALLDALEDGARAAGAERMVLTTGEPQVAAVRFYRARGYVDVAPFGFYAGSPTAVHLGKRLGARRVP